MKIKSFLTFIPVLFIWLILTGSAGLSKKNPSEKDMSSSLFALNGYTPFEYDDFDLIENLEITDWARNRFIQLSGNSRKGRAEKYFSDPSAQYDITILTGGSGDGNASIELLINDKSIGKLMPGAGRQKTFTGINIQQWSKITLIFLSGGEKKVLFEKLLFTPAGPFSGKGESLSKPVLLDIFETRAQQTEARQMLGSFVRLRIDELNKKRMDELDSLKSQLEWKERQKKIRERLPQYFGKFPEKTPLNPRIIGKIEHDLYTIEKIIFESQPGYLVPANLFVPKNRKFPLPGVVVPCGHYNDAKTYEDYHKVGLGLVLKGYVVLIYDPMGQGERSEYFDPVTLKTPFYDGGYVGVDEHHYVGRPAFLAGWTLAGLRTWDGIRAIDYLVSRPEVDKDQLAAVGNSGGGIMSMIITAVDERIKVCAVSHPGGSCEEFFLEGQRLIRSEILSLIPPRPLRITVGINSGEEPEHRRKLEDIQLFYEGLACGKESGDLEMVPGIHSMSRPNREAAYEWLNKWFDKQSERKEEAEIHAEEREDLWCTEKGNTIASLGSETGQTLNTRLIGKIYRPAKDPAVLKERIASRIRLTLPEKRDIPAVKSYGTLSQGEISFEKLTFESESGIIVHALLIKPDKVKPGSPMYLFTSDRGKPDRLDLNTLPLLLARDGNIVLAIDVRGTGETSPTPPLGLTRYTGHSVLQWIHDSQALQSLTFGRTMAGMRTFDLIRSIDFIQSRDDLKDRKIIAAGEGQGGLWSMMAAIYDSRIAGILTTGTLPSYKLLITNQYYNVWGYFWIPGALYDFDISDLPGLVAPRNQIWLDPVDNLGEKLKRSEALAILGKTKNMQIIRSDELSSKDIVSLIHKTFR